MFNSLSKWCDHIIRSVKPIGLLFILIITFTFNAHAKGMIPEQAYDFKETIKTELDKHFNTIPDYNYVPALVEHESCLSLSHSRCWNSKSQFKTSREEGAGLGMVTRAYTKDGNLRFDTLGNMRKQYKNELKEASWSNIYSKPEVQIRIIVLMLRDDYKKLYNIKDEESRLQMVDAAYNGGYGGLIKDRRSCALKAECDPNLWFGNVETTCTKSRRILYGNRNACDINRHHVKDVFTYRLPKYQNEYFLPEDLIDEVEMIVEIPVIPELVTPPIVEGNEKVPVVEVKKRNSFLQFIYGLLGIK